MQRLLLLENQDLKKKLDALDAEIALYKKQRADIKKILKAD